MSTQEKQQVEIQVEGKRVYIKTPYGHPAVAKLKALGCKWDPESKRWWCGLAKKDKVDLIVQANLEAPAPTEEPDNTKVLAKVKYKTSTYYVIAESQATNRCRICLLFEKMGFWVPMEECELIKTYSPKTWTNRGHTMTDYVTLGSIRRFVKEQKEAEARGEDPCASCGKRGRLVLDHEDGLMKCKGCCDMPGEDD